jgi:ubiquinone/menaquinone biosynthesis C-methylase UbiE
VADYRNRFQNRQSAESYAARFEHGTRLRTSRREQRAVWAVFSRLPDCRTILDLPCGAGRFQPALDASGRRIIEMDVSEHFVAIARDRAGRTGDRCGFIVGDAAQVPLPDGCVDAILCNRLLHHFTASADRARFLREFHRITRKYLVLSFFDYLAFGSLRRVLKALKGRKVNYAGQPTLAQFCNECRAAGFELQRVVPTGPIWVAQKYLVLARRD